MFFLRGLFGFKGRINRGQYWAGIGAIGLINTLALFLMMAPAISANDLGGELQAAMQGGLMMMPLRLAGSVVGVSLNWRRFHDRGKSGWLSLIPMLLGVPFFLTAMSMQVDDPVAAFGTMLPLLGLLGLVGVWFFIELGLMPGQPLANKYGDPPGGRSAGQPAAGGVDWDAAARPQAASTWAGAEAALEQAIAERRRGPSPSPAADVPTGRPAPGLAQPQIVQPASSSGFGRRGL